MAAAPDTGAPDFAQLQRRFGLTPSSALLAEVQVTYVVFDVLDLDGQPTTAMPYLRRRELLSELKLAHPRMSSSPHQIDIDPRTLFDIAVEHDLEGVVGKRLDSPYRSGRSTAWAKKARRNRLEVIVGGWIPSNDGRGPGLGSLLIGRPAPVSGQHPGGVDFVGGVGTGCPTR